MNVLFHDRKIKEWESFEIKLNTEFINLQFKQRKAIITLAEIIWFGNPYDGATRIAEIFVPKEVLARVEDLVNKRFKEFIKKEKWLD